MSDTKHTPGRLSTRHGLSASDPRWILENDESFVAVTTGGNNEANAKRLALCWNSHDDLLEALQNLVEADLHADGEGLWNIADSDTEDGESAVKAARAAIAKATEELRP